MAGLWKIFWSQSENCPIFYKQLVLFRDLIENWKPIKVGFEKEDGKAKEILER